MSGFDAILTKRTALSFFWLALAMIWTATAAQAQTIAVYPSQDDPTKTLWIFSPSATNPTDTGNRAIYGSSIRSSGNFHLRDSWKTSTHGGLYTANKPTNQLFSLTPLFSSTNHPKDIDSITIRLPGRSSFGPFSTNTTLFGNSSVTNAPTISTSIGSKTIGSIFMNDTSTADEIGIRGAPGGGNLAYTNMQRIYVFGSGIMDKPIGDFTFSHHMVALTLI